MRPRPLRLFSMGNNHSRGVALIHAVSHCIHPPNGLAIHLVVETGNPPVVPRSFYRCPAPAVLSASDSKQIQSTRRSRESVCKLFGISAEKLHLAPGDVGQGQEVLKSHLKRKANSVGGVLEGAFGSEAECRGQRSLMFGHDS